MKKNKMLMVATVPSMIGQFNMSNIKLLEQLGYVIEVACNWNDRSVWTEERIKTFEEELKKRKINLEQINFTRNPLNIKCHIQSYKQLKKIVKEGNYDFVHCHTPIAAAITRIVLRKFKDVKVIYTAHGFHFYKGAAVLNWLLYYPVEKILSRYTDILITINKEDYQRAKENFACERVEYIPGVGLDLEKFTTVVDETIIINEDFSYIEDKFVILSVGELNENKNHQVIIRALKELNNPNVVYVIAGQGARREELEQLCKELNVDKQVFFLGFCRNVQELYRRADIFAFPSIREGLGLASLEAMSFGIPLLTSNVHGINDYSISGKSGFSYNSKDVKGFAEGIIRLYEDVPLREQMGEFNKEQVKKFDIKIVEDKMKSIYESIKE